MITIFLQNENVKRRVIKELRDAKRKAYYVALDGTMFMERVVKV